jgi:glutathione reductase (NADPH)
VSTRDFDVIVIGSGVAGQTAAEELAAAGRHVAIVERAEVGGTCGLRGCEPKKVLVAGAEPAERATAQAGHGPSGDVVTDWAALIDFKRRFTDPASAAIEAALVGSGAEIIRGSAAFSGPSSLTVDGRPLTAEHFVVATGARPVPLAVPGAQHVITSAEFMAAETLGRRVVFVGGGYISFEFAHVAVSAGAEVYIVHRGPRVLGGFDADLADMLVDGYRRRGMDVRLGAALVAVETEAGALVVVLGDGSRLACDMVVHGAGRAPDLGDLGLDAAGVTFGARGVEVDAHMRSVSNPRVWSAGDACADGPPLTPVGVAQARVIVRNILGDRDAVFAPVAVPSVVFSDPPLARLGLDLADAAALGLDVESRLVDMSSWVSAQRVGARVSGARVLIDKRTRRIVGAHILAHNAEETINVFAAIVAGGLTVDEVKTIPWAYPTSSSEIGYLL